MISVLELENKVYELDEIRIVIRCNKNEKVKDFKYNRKCDKDVNISDYIINRIKPLLSNNIDVTVIDGNGCIPHTRTKIETIRNSYIK